MRFGVLRPERGTRSFWREVAIIIFGVLIALALEQALADWRERQRMADVRASIDEELADFRNVLEIRLLASPCVESKLPAIDRALSRSGAAGPWNEVGRPPFFFSSNGAWDSDASSLISRHLGPRTFRSYGEVYRSMEHFEALMMQEQAYWIRLRTLERQDEPLDRGRRRDLIEASVAAGSANTLLTAIGEQTLSAISRLGVSTDSLLPSAELRARPICQPLLSRADG